MNDKMIKNEIIKIAKELSVFDKKMGASKNIVSTKDNFGIDDDGWDKHDLENLLDLFGDFSQIRYELDGCVRGTHGVSGDTLQDLVNTLSELQDRLEDEIEKIDKHVK